MPRSLNELLETSDPAWPVVLQWISSARNHVQILPPADPDRSKALEEAQVSTRSTMGAIVYETGGALIDSGWLRIIGSGHPRLSRALMQWNRTAGSDGFLLIADDVVGGFFAINGGAFGGDLKNVYYFAPESLRWESLELGYSDFLGFAVGGDIEKFYEHLRWPNWAQETSQIGGDQALSFQPPLWTAEGKNVAASTRQLIPVAEAYDFNVRFMPGKLKNLPNGTQFSFKVK
jgi:hypothetical protein